MSHDRFVHKELVTVIIEKALEIRFPAYDAIVTTLREKHDCEISDCETLNASKVHSKNTLEVLQILSWTQ